MHFARTLRGAATAVLSTMVVATAIAGPMSGTALAKGPRARATMPAVTVNPNTSPTSSSTMVFSWTPTSGQTYSCTLTGPGQSGAKTSCPGSASYSGLTTGSYTFAVRVTQSGFRAGSYTHVWAVDRTGPTAPSPDPIPTPTSNRTQNVTWSPTEAGETFQCALNDSIPADATACSSPWQLPVAPATQLAEGSYTAYVYGIDALGNKTNTPGTVSWTVDLTAPSSPVITITPIGPTNQTSANVTWTDGDATTFTCILDAAPAVSCKSPWQIGPVGEGTHVVTIQGTDAAQNVGVPGIAHWVVDLTPPPAPSITSGPAKVTDQTSGLFYFSDADSTATFQCSVDGAVYASCASPYLFSEGTTPTAPEPHVFSVKATDQALNTGPAASYTWTIDPNVQASPPEITAGPAALTNNTAPSFTFDSLDDPAATFLCAVDPADSTNQAAYTSCTSPQAENVSTDGTHTFYVEEVSSASGSSLTSTADSWTWTLDQTPPPAPVLNSNPNLVSNVKTPLFSFSDAEANVTYTCQRDALPTFACVSPVTVSTLTDGQHTFTVSATDPAGNSDATTSKTSYTWTVDTVAPGKPTVTGADPSGTSPEISLSDPSDSDVASYLCTLDTSAPASCSSTVDYTNLAPGSHTLLAQAVDQAGNVGQPQSFTWSVDGTVPTQPTIDSGPAALVNTRTADIGYSMPDSSATGVQCWLDNQPTLCTFGVTPTSGTVHLTQLADGDHTFSVVAVNSLGNTNASQPYNWTVDATSPAAPAIGGPAGLVNSASEPVSFSDTSTDVTGYTCSLDGGTAGACLPSYDVGDGAHSLVAWASDAAGNKSVASAPLTWSVDTVKPVLTITGAPSGTTSNPNVSLSVTQQDANPGSISCSLTGPVSSTSCASLPNLPDGSYTFTATTTDKAGNVATPATASWTVKALVTGPIGGPTDTTAPTVTSVSATKTLTGSSNAGFSETVHGLVSGGVAMVVAGTSSVVPTSVKCLSGSTVVACSGNFTSLQITPSAALTAGQHYTIRFNAGAVQDTAGNALVAKTSDFRASLGEQENSTGARAAWAVTRAKAALGGSFVRQNLSGSSLSYTFTGSTLTWWTVTGKDQGKATVYIDGKKKATVNNYAAGTHFKVGRKYANLGNKRHTVKIVVNGVKGATAGTGTFVSVDAFSVGTKRTNTPVVTMTLHSVNSSRFSGGHATSDNVKGDAVTFTFRGTGIAFYTQTGRNQGKVAVYVDGVKKATIDNYSAGTKYGVARAISKLSDTVHTLKLVVLGTHHKGGTGNWVTVDRFLVS